MHRGNSPVNEQSPIEQVRYYIDAGFTKIEIDIYATSEMTYKFCHPQDDDKVEAIHDLYDGYLEKLVAKYPNVEWFVDLKCLNLDEVPLKMMQHLSDTFGNQAVFVAAQAEILEFMNNQGRQTGQYFKENIEQSLSYEPDFYIQSMADDLKYPNQKTIVQCPTIDGALDSLSRGFAGATVDGCLLINTVR